MTENQVSRPQNILTSPEQERNVQHAMEILNKGASSPVERAVVRKAFDYVQEIKRGPKGNYSASLRYGHAVTTQQREAARKAAAGLERTLNALRPVVHNYQLRLDEQAITSRRTTKGGRTADLTALESLQEHLQTIADSKVRPGSKFDPRMLLAVHKTVMLLKAAGKSWSSTRDGDADQLAEALWGEPDTDFQQYLLRYSRLRHRRSQRVTASQPGTA